MREKVDWRQGAPVFIVLGLLFLFSIAVGLLVWWLAPRDPHVRPSAVCLGNLRSLTVALQTYAADHAEVLPPVSEPTSRERLEGALLPEGADPTGSWSPGDWQLALLTYAAPDSFVCPISRSAYSYQLNSNPEGLSLQFVPAPGNFAVLWDTGLREHPGEGPHGGGYAIVSLEGLGFVTTGEDDLARRLRFEP